MQQLNQGNLPLRDSTPSGGNYADIVVKPGGDAPMLSPTSPPIQPNYSEVYVADRSVNQEYSVVSNTVPIPDRGQNEQAGYVGNYERMNFAEESFSR